MTCFDDVSMTSGYARYLDSKTTVDDRALNRQVLAELRRLMSVGAPRVLEVGAGLGTMVARLLDWGVVGAGEYVLLDADRELLDCSRLWLRDWAAARGVRSDLLPDGLQVGDLRVRLVHAELGGYLEAAHGELADVLIANAVLDLVDVAAVLPGLLRLLVPGGVYWFTINYDGESIFTPSHPHDEQVMRAYHRDMDERIRYGRRRRKLHGPSPVPPPAGCGSARNSGGVVGLGRVPGHGRELPSRRGLLPAQHPEHNPGRIAESPGSGGSGGPGRLAGRALSAAGCRRAGLHRSPA